jgi:uncharacterized protein (TIGR00251 family)
VIHFSENEEAVTFKVRVQPRASRTEAAGEHAGAIKLRIAAPPVDGKANEECRRFLAKQLGVASGAVKIISGDTAREKVIRVRGVSAERVRETFGV